MNKGERSNLLPLANILAVFFVLFNHYLFPNYYYLSYLVSLVIVGFLLKKTFSDLDVSFWFIISYVGLFYVNPLYFEITGREYFDAFGAIDESYVNLYSLYTISSMHVFLYFNSLFSLNYRSKQPLINEIKIDRPKRLDISFFLLVVSIVLLVSLDIGLSGLLSLSRNELRESRGGFSLLALYLSYSSLPMIFLYGIMMRLKYSFYKLLLVLVIGVFMFLIFRSRTFIIAQSICFLLGYIISSPNIQKMTNVYNKFILYMPGILFLAIFIRFFRGYFELYGFFEAFSQVDIMFAIEETVVLGDLGYSPVVMRVMELFSSEELRLNGDSYLKLLFAIIPYSISGTYIVDTQIIIGSLFYPNLSGMTLPPGVQGDTYANFGLWGVILFAFYGAAFSLSARLKFEYKLIFFFCIFTTVYHFVRGAFTNPVIIAVLIMSSTILIVRLSGFRFSNEK